MHSPAVHAYSTIVIQSSTPLLDIAFIGPVGSGKSSLIGSLYRAVNEEEHFPDRIQLTLNHPEDDSHGTMHWMETSGNARRTVVYQDTRGDQVSQLASGRWWIFHLCCGIKVLWYF